MQLQDCNTKKREPREEPGHGDGCPSPAGVQACSQTFPTSTSPLHSTQSLLAARNYGGSSWSSLDCGLAVSRPGEHLRKWRGQQARDSETPWEGTACAAVQQRLERVQGMPVGIFPHSCSDPQHYTPQPGPPQHRPCSLLGCPFTHLQDTAQVPAPASSLLLLGHHPHLAQSRSEVVHRHPSPPAGQGTAEQAPAPHKKSKPARCSRYQLLPEHQSKISPRTRVLSERQSQEKQQQPQL